MYQSAIYNFVDINDRFPNEILGMTRFPVHCVTFRISINDTPTFHHIFSEFELFLDQFRFKLKY